MPQIESLETRQLLSHAGAGRPAAPTNLLAVPDGTAPIVRLTWTDNATNEGGYTVMRRKGRSGTWATIANLPANSTYYRDARVASGTSYLYSLYVFNRRRGTFVAAPVSVTTHAPGMPVVDGTFGSGGNAVDATRGYAGQVALSSDGQTIYALSAYAAGDASHSTVMVNAFNSTSGSAATAFANGLLDVNAVLPTPLVTAGGLAVQADGKILVAGDMTDNPSNNPSDIAVARFNPDGTLDTTFAGGTGELVTNFNNKEQVGGVAVAADGSIYVAGDDGDSAGYHQQLFAVRLRADGTVDTSYGTNGIVEGDRQTLAPGLQNVRGYQLKARAMALDPTDDSVVIVGQFGLLDNNGVQGNGSMLGARLLADGTVADKFTDTVSGTSDDAGAGPLGVLVDSSRRIVVVGTADYAGNTLRFNADGSPDTSWVGPGTVVRPQYPPTEFAQFDGVAQLADGSYVVVGSRNFGNAFIAHLNAADGSLIGGFVVNAPQATYDTVAVTPDGSLFAAGALDDELLVTKYQVL